MPLIKTNDKSVSVFKLKFKMKENKVVHKKKEIINYYIDAELIQDGTKLENVTISDIANNLKTGSTINSLVFQIYRLWHTTQTTKGWAYGIGCKIIKIDYTTGTGISSQKKYVFSKKNKNNSDNEDNEENDNEENDNEEDEENDNEEDEDNEENDNEENNSDEEKNNSDEEENNSDEESE